MCKHHEFRCTHAQYTRMHTYRRTADRRRLGNDRQMDWASVGETLLRFLVLCMCHGCAVQCAVRQELLEIQPRCKTHGDCLKNRVTVTAGTVAAGRMMADIAWYFLPYLWSHQPGFHGRLSTQRRPRELLPELQRTVARSALRCTHGCASRSLLELEARLSGSYRRPRGSDCAGKWTIEDVRVYRATGMGES